MTKIETILTKCGYCFYTTIGVGLRAQKREDLTNIEDPFFGSWVYPSGAAFGPYHQHRCLSAYAGNRYTVGMLVEKFGENALLEAVARANKL